MSIVEYNKALKLGEKEYRAAVSKGQSPYLPVLDDILEHAGYESQVPLGLVQIPISFIAGTYSSGRTTAFARNFMPILESGSEFSSKWSTLYDALEAEGLRDPIKAYEFNNKFYVVEGNKRVSVLKFMGAVSIEANVTRIIPKKDENDPDVRRYYEFLDFYNLTGINYVNVMKEGTYQKILQGTGHDLQTPWTEDDKLDFNSVYYYFDHEFRAKNQDRLNIGSGDAFAAYLEIYSYDEAKNKTEADFRKEIANLWNEFMMLNNDEEVRLVLSPTDESKKVALVKLFPVGTPVLKVAFIHDKGVQNSAWTYSHELGRKYIQDIFGDKIEASCIERVAEDTADDVFEAAIEAGNKVIFATSPKLCTASLKAALAHPEVKILNCSMMLNHKNVRGYYLRMYEAKFISGAIAGSLSDNGYVGYLSDYPIRGTTAEINAFALGVQMTAPGTKVALEWKMVKNRNYEEEFRMRDVKIISGKDLNATIDKTREYGLFKVADDGAHINLAMPVRHWGKLYEEIIRSVMRGAYKNDDTATGTRALNYFWGMNSGAVDVIYSRNLPAGSIRLLRTLREGITNMNINPFTGPFTSQDGILRCEDGASLTPEDAVAMDWLIDNVEGHIPDIDELEDEAVELVKVQGIKQEEKLGI